MVDASTAAKKILNARGIKRVVVVDDAVKPPQWYGYVDQLDDEERATIGHEIGFNLLSSDWRDQLDVANTSVRKIVRREVSSRAQTLGLAQPELIEGDSSLANLSKVLKSHQPKQFNPQQWQACSDELLERAVKETTLFLIDEKLGNGRTGGSLVKDLISKSHEGCYFCILTDDTNVENEFDYWKKMCKKYELGRTQVGILSKEHLVDTKNNIGFARMLKISLTANEVEKIRSSVIAASQNGVELALERFEELGVPELTSLVFESSRQEGAWEVETLVRVVMAFVNKSLDDHLYGNTEVAEATKRISAVASVSTGSDQRLVDATFDIQHAERYINADYLTARRMSLANGDLFEIGDINGSLSLWVLAAQSCDLVIRPSGKRNGSPTHLPILPVQSTNEAPRGTHVELPHYIKSDGVSAFVLLNRPSYVPTSILDLAAFSPAGVAAWSRGAEVGAMSTVGCTKRAEALSEEFEQAFAVPDESNEDLRRQLVACRLPAAEHPTVRAEITPESVRYAVKRVGRLRERQAEAVLQAFGLALSRTAEAHNLARISPSGNPATVFES